MPGVIAVISQKIEKLLKTRRKGVSQKNLCSFFKYSTIIDLNLYYINVAGLPEIL